MKVLEGEVKGFAFKLEHKYIKRKIKIREEKNLEDQPRKFSI